jgi:carbamoyltransferase
VKILGIGLSHCAGVALIDDGRVIFAQEEDRFSRRRRHKGWPDQSLAYALQTFDLVEEDIDLCVLCDVQTAKVLKRGIKAKKTISVHHHLAHVMSGWALVQWPDFDAVSIDGGGDYGSWQSYGAVRGRELINWESDCGSRLTEKYEVRRSLLDRRRPGTTFGSYWSVPAVLNFGMLDSNGIGGYEGKLMGLAGHGDAARFDRIANHYDGSFSVGKTTDYHYILTHGGPKIGDSGYVTTKDGRRFSLADARRLRKEAKEIVYEYDLKNKQDLAFAADFAAYLQGMTNQVMVELFQKNFTPDRPVVVSGGTFGNVVVNGLLNARYQLYVTPPMGDDGLALGAAAWGAYVSGIREIDISNMYLGFDAGTNVDVDPGEVADLLIANKTVGLMEGRMELGPRALGARTILADPQDPNSNITINERLGRVEYMPFAPVILEEHASDVLIGWNPAHMASRHMTLVYPVQDKWRERLKGVVHVDSTVRPQVIRRLDNPVYYDILKAYYDRTGIPVLINTSFNAHGEPILRTMEQGLEALREGRVDALVAGNQLTIL